VAKQTITRLVDDLDGADADRTVEFSLDGVNYIIDLSDKNAGKLRTALSPYLDVATRAGRSGIRSPGGRRTGSAAPPSSRAQNAAIREWAGKNGYEIADRGRIPASVVDAYHAR
jgi:hypothetical protein